MYKCEVNSCIIFDPQNSVLGNVGIIPILQLGTLRLGEWDCLPCGHQECRLCPQLCCALPVCHWAGVLPTQVLLFFIKGLGDRKGKSAGEYLCWHSISRLGCSLKQTLF